MKFTVRKKIATAFATVAILGAGSMAFAYWSSTGTGSGTGSTGTASAVTINQTSVVSAMGPGVAAQPLSGTFTVAHPAYVGQVTITGVTTDQAGCTTADFQTTDPSATDAEVTTGDTWSGGSIVFVNDPARNQDACQGATVTIAYSSN